MIISQKTAVSLGFVIAYAVAIDLLSKTICSAAFNSFAAIGVSYTQPIEEITRECISNATYGGAIGLSALVIFKCRKII